MNNAILPATMDYESFLKVVAQYMVAEVSDLRLGYKFGTITAQRIPNGLPSSLSSENEYNNMIDRYLETVEKQKKPKRKNTSNESTKPTKIWICDVRTKEEIEQAKKVLSLGTVDNSADSDYFHRPSNRAKVANSLRLVLPAMRRARRKARLLFKACGITFPVPSIHMECLATLMVTDASRLPPSR